MKWILPAAALAACLCLNAAPGAASEADWKECERVDDQAARIRGCTGVIEDKAEKPESRADAYYYRGNAYGGKGEYDKAIADYNQAIGLFSDYVAAYAARGWALSEKGDLASAFKDLDKAIGINPNNALALTNRGAANEKKGDVKQAIADYKAALAVKSDLDDDYDGQDQAREALVRLEPASAAAKPAK